MNYPLGNSALAKADYLVTNKGEMSVELWNDRAQCVLAPLAAEVRALRSQVAVLEASLLAGRAEVEGLRGRVDIERATNDAHCYVINGLEKEHAELVRLVREYMDAYDSRERWPYPKMNDAFVALRAAVRGDPGASGSGEGT